MQKLPIWLILSFVALLATGCGSSRSSTSGSQGTSVPNATTPKTATSSTGSAPTTSTGKSELKELAVNACRSRIQSEPALTSAEKVRLEKVCSKAADGASASREVARQVCVEVIKHSALPGSPENPARKRALAACKKAK
jgi:uncharacterized protein YceK